MDERASKDMVAVQIFKLDQNEKEDDSLKNFKDITGFLHKYG